MRIELTHIEQLKPNGTRELRFETTVDWPGFRGLLHETGRVFTLEGVWWDRETGLARVLLRPGNGCAAFHDVHEDEVKP